MGVIMGSLFVAFKNDQQGNVAMMFGGLIFVLLGLLALAIDFSKAYNMRASLTDVADSAALAGAYVATTDIDNREAVVQNIIEFHLANANIENQTSSINFDDTSSELVVTLRGQVQTSFAGLFGFSKLNVAGQSVTTFGQNNINPISLAFVLDVSGSMNGQSSSGGSKIEALQSSVETMFDVIEDTAPRKDVLQTKIRTGMTAFDIDLVTEHTVPMGFGWTTVEHEVFDLKPSGDTNTTPAFDLAFQMLANDTHNADNLRKFLILMTDGENDDLNENANTIVLCNQAKAQGIQVFSIAFEAPQEGQDLLRACASGNNEISDESDTQSVTISADLNQQGNTVPVANDAETDGQQYYFDAQNANELEAAFRQIGQEIGRFEPRIIR